MRRRRLPLHIRRPHPRPGRVQLPRRARRARCPRAGATPSPPPPVTGRHAMVVSEHPLASEVGRRDPAARRQRDRRGGGRRLRAGGGEPARRATSAAAASWCTARRTAQVFSLDYRETAPAAAGAEHVPRLRRRTSPSSSVIGALAAGVPGVGGRDVRDAPALRPPRRGATCVAPAIALARGPRGGQHRATTSSAATSASWRRFPTSAAIFLARRRPPAARRHAAPAGPRAHPRAHRRRRAPTASTAARPPTSSWPRCGAAAASSPREDLAGYRAIWRDPVQSDLPRLAHHRDAAGLERRRDADRDPQHPRGLSAAGVRLGAS